MAILSYPCAEHGYSGVLPLLLKVVVVGCVIVGVNFESPPTTLR